MMKSMTIFVAAVMLAMSGVAYAGNPGYDDGGKCKGGSYCDDGGSNGGGTGGNGGNGGNGGAGGHGGDATAGAIGVGVGIGVGVANAEANASSSANAGALAGAAVVGSGNSDVDVKNTNTAFGGAVVGSGNSEVDVRTTNTNLNANTNTLGQQQGQVQGQQQGQVAFGGSATGGSINISGGGEGSEGGQAPFSSNVTVAEGAVQNSNTNTASATGGSVASGAVVNNVTVQTPEGNNGIQIESGGSLGGSQASGNETQVQVDARTFNESKTVIPVASAAPSFSSICSSGAGGQAKDWGFSVAVTNAVCQHLMMADAMMALGDREAAIKHVRKAERHANVKGFFNYFLHVGTLGIL